MSYFQVLNYNDITGEQFNGQTITSLEIPSTLGFEMGIGYTIGRWSVRVDIVPTLSPNMIGLDNNPPTEEALAFSGLAVVYWF